MLKIFEVLVLLGAGILFFWWQFDDLRRARESSRKKKQLEREGLNSVNRRTVVSTRRKLALIARAASVAFMVPAAPAVALSPVPAIHYLVDIVSRERNPSEHAKPWTVPSRSFEERVEWMVDLFGKLEQRERTVR